MSRAKTYHQTFAMLSKLASSTLNLEYSQILAISITIFKSQLEILSETVTSPSGGQNPSTRQDYIEVKVAG
ncbi:hypothetical protein Npun_R0674 [Nostoc punctiforme PCC 73102]|uniref:Uncharacterized protein n=2 Tax=Nostoc punctiforme TaxID=272131 RepID=B2J9C7_NOSP7|nr:hypothetical protein Npun_R0674 [Nostoc punctiforme PCC 73102]